MRTEEILATIDHALEDWEVSGDAMRWTPEPVAPRVTVAAPRQQGRVSFHNLGPARLWFAPTGTPPNQMHMHSELSGAGPAVFGGAIREASEAMARAFAVSAADIAQMAATLTDLSSSVPEETAEDPRARALRLRQNRNTGPAMPRAQVARRPRSHR